MKHYIVTKKGKITVIEPDVNKLYEELTQLTVLSYHWSDNDKSKPYAELMKQCLKARNKRKLIYGYEQNDPKKTNKFYTNNLSENFSIYISGNNVLIDNKEIKPANLYIRLIKSGLIFYKRNNPFNVKRKGLFDIKYYIDK